MYFFIFNSEGDVFEYFGVYYKDIMYYLSTDPAVNVVKHILENGNENRVVRNSRIPNEHQIATRTYKLQGHSLKYLHSTFNIDTKSYHASISIRTRISVPPIPNN